MQVDAHVVARERERVALLETGSFFGEMSTRRTGRTASIIVESHLERGWSAWLNSPPRMVVRDWLWGSGAR